MRSPLIIIDHQNVTFISADTFHPTQSLSPTVEWKTFSPLETRYNELSFSIILLTKTAAAENEVALSYHRVRGLCFLAFIFVETIVVI